MANKLNVVVGANIDEFAKAMKQIAKEVSAIERQFSGFEKVGNRLSGIGTSMSIGITAPIMAAGAAATKFAMDAVESENLFEVSMGNMAGAAREWSNQLSDALGLNEYELRKNVGTLNVMLGSMGMGEQASYDMAKGLTQLSYDMASFYDIKPEEAFEKLRSGISGEAEPLKQLGILVNDNTIKAYAYKNGIAEQGKELTDHQKILARYGAIMEQTSKAQMNMSLTAESPTNQTRILVAQLQKAGKLFGDEILPAFAPLIAKLVEMAKWLANLSPEAKRTIVVIGGIVAAVGPLLFMFGKLLVAIPQMAAGFETLKKTGDILKNGFSALTSPIGLTVLAIAGMAAIALVVYENWDKISTWFSNMWATLGYKAKQFGLSIELTFAKMVSGLLKIIAPVAKLLPDALGGKAFDDAQKAFNNYTNNTQKALDNLRPPVMKTAQEVNGLKKSTDDLSLASAYNTKVTDENSDAANENAESKKTVKDVQDELGRKLAVATQNEAALGDQFDENTEKANLVENAIKELTDMGLKASDPVIQQLVAQWKSYNVETDKTAGVLARVDQELQNATVAAATFGTEDQLAQTKVDILKQAIQGLINDGIGPGNLVFDALVTRMKAFQDEANNTATASQSLGDVMANAFVKMMGSAEQLSGNIVKFFDTIGSGEKSFKDAMKDSLLAIVSGLEQQVIAQQLLLQGWGVANAPMTFGASLAAMAAAMPGVLGALAGFELVKAGIRALATGALVTGPTLALVGEGQYEEAVLPLNNAVFSQIASGVAERMQGQAVAPGAGQEIHLHVGTLVADDLGLKKLERSLAQFRISENTRRGVGV